MFLKNREVSIGLKGGLGNQLFQIAAVLHYAKKFNFNPVFEDKKRIHEREVDVGGYTYWDVFNTKSNLVLKDVGSKKYKLYNEKQFSYKKFKRKFKDIRLNGYYQSPKYLNLVKDDMTSFLWSNNEVTKRVNQLYHSMVSLYNTEELTSIHIRRGDYIKLQDIHPIQPISYYIQAIHQFSEDTPLIIFSNDQEWCKKELSKAIKNPLYFVSDKDYVEILLMSKIKNNIIANSSFSWWSAYLNTHTDKKVIAPKKWFGDQWVGPRGDKNWSDIYCEEWIKL